MAVFNEILVGRFGSLLTKAFQMVGVGNPAPQLESSVQPTLNIWNYPPEYAYLAEDYLFAGSGNVTGGVGKQGFISLANPANSGALVIVDQIIVAMPGGAGGVEFAYATTASPAAAGSVVTRQRDARSVRNSLCTLTSGTDVSTGWPTTSGIMQVWSPTTSFNYTVPIILQPQNALVVYCDSNAVQLFVAFTWHERVQLKSELTIK